MKIGRFMVLLAITSMLAFISDYIICLLPSIAQHFRFAIQSTLFFIFLSLFIYFFTYLLAYMGKTSLLTGWIMGVVLLKLMFCGAFIWLHFKKPGHTNNYFIVPFFINYFIYTIFELMFLNRFVTDKNQVRKGAF